MCIRDRLRGEPNKQVTRISVVQESIALKIAEIGKSVSSVEGAMSNKISYVEDIVATVKNSVSIIKK